MGQACAKPDDKVENFDEKKMKPMRNSQLPQDVINRITARKSARSKAIQEEKRATQKLSQNLDEPQVKEEPPVNPRLTVRDSRKEEPPANPRLTIRESRQSHYNHGLDDIESILQQEEQEEAKEKEFGLDVPIDIPDVEESDDQKHLWGQEDDPGEIRWVLLPASIKKAEEAQLWADKWCAEQNKLVYGTFTFKELKLENIAKPCFRVHFLVSKRNFRYILYQDPKAITSDQVAKDSALMWVNKQNKLVFGQYSFVEHNFGQVEDPKYLGFKVHFRPSPRKLLPGVVADEWFCLGANVQTEQEARRVATQSAIQLNKHQKAIQYGVNSVSVMLSKQSNQMRYHFIISDVKTIPVQSALNPAMVPTTSQVISSVVEKKPPLFERIGGEAAVDAAVELFYSKVLNDQRVNSFFTKSDMTRQRQMQKQFLTFAFGGNTRWNGKSMRAAHRNMKLDESHFNAIAEDLVNTLKELNVAQSLIDEVVAVLLTTKDQVLNRKPEDQGTDNWVCVDKEHLTHEQATSFAHEWIRNKNSANQGQYTLKEVAVMIDKHDNKSKFHFLVNYKKPSGAPEVGHSVPVMAMQQRKTESKERLVQFNGDSLTPQSANLKLQEWISEQNRLVYGKYSFVKMAIKMLGEKAVYQFTVKFEPTKKSERWIKFDDQSNVNPTNAQDLAQLWVRKQNVTSYFVHKVTAHNVGLEGQEFKAFLVSFYSQNRRNVSSEGRWIRIEQQGISLEDAQKYADSWTAKQNKKTFSRLKNCGVCVKLNQSTNQMLYHFRVIESTREMFKEASKPVTKSPQIPQSVSIKDAGSDRWILACSSCQTEEQANKFGAQWVEQMNKAVHGRYTLLDVSVMLNQKTNRMMYYFLVNFRTTKRGEKPSESLYERIGGSAAVDAAVDLFYKKVLADPRISAYFASTDMSRQIRKQKSFLTYAFGGPTRYSGKTLRAAHAKMNLTDMHFTAVAENLQAALRELGVPSGLISQVIAVAASVKPDVLNLSSADQPMQEKSLFEQLGGEAAVDATVELFYKKVVADPRISSFFNQTNMARQIKKQKQFLTFAFGGPSRYTGKAMRAAHAKMNLKEEHFQAVAENLVASLQELSVPSNLIAQVVNVAASVKDDVLNAPRDMRIFHEPACERWVLAEEQQGLTIEKVATQANLWCEKMNKLIFGKYQVIDTAVMLDKADNQMKYYFKVRQEIQKKKPSVKRTPKVAQPKAEAPEGRWIMAPQQCLTQEQAVEHAQTWVSSMNKQVYGSYKLADLAVKLDQKDNQMKFFFQVTFAPLKRGQRSQMRDQPLFEKVGGPTQLMAIVEKLFDKLKLDPRVASLFSNVNADKQRQTLYELLSFAFEAPESSWQRGASFICAQDVSEMHFQSVCDVIFTTFADQDNIPSASIPHLMSIVSESKFQLFGLDKCPLQYESTSTRWIALPSKTFQSCEEFAKSWVEAKNKVTYGVYKLIETDLCHFKVSFQRAPGSFQWISYPTKEAQPREWALEWCQKNNENPKMLYQYKLDQLNEKMHQFKVFIRCKAASSTYKYAQLPTKRPIPTPATLEQSAVIQTDSKLAHRWVKLANQDLTPKQAEQEAQKWIEAQNKLVYGQYSFVEVSFENMSYKFKVSFAPAKASLLQRVGGQPTFKKALAFLQEKIKYDPRINCAFEADQILNFSLGSISHLKGVKLNAASFNALKDDVFFALAELSIAKPIIDEVMQNLEQAQIEKPETVALEILEYKLKHDPRLCSLVNNDQLDQLVNLHDVFIKNALTGQIYTNSWGETQKLANLLKLLKFEETHLNAIAQDLSSTLANADVKKPCIDKVIQVYVKTVMSEQQIQKRNKASSPTQNEIYKYVKVPTGRPVPQADLNNQKQDIDQTSEEQGTDRWIVLTSQELTPGQAKQRASSWVETQNKYVYGTYTLVDINFSGSFYKFKVNFKPQRASLFQRIKGMQIFNRALEILKNLIEFDPRIKCPLKLADFLNYCLGKSIKSQAFKISEVSFNALRDDVFKTLAELDVAKIFIDQVLNNIEKVRAECVTDGPVAEAIDPQIVAENFAKRVRFDPRLCNRVGDGIDQLAVLHEPIIKVAIGEGDQSAFQDSALSTLLESKGFEQVHYAALTQNLRMTLADVGIAMQSIEQVINEYASSLKQTQKPQAESSTPTPYKFEQIPTGRPIPGQPEPLRAALQATEAAKTSERWIIIKNLDLTPPQAKQEAITWVQKQNQVVYGEYQFIEISFTGSQYKFKTIYTAPQSSLYQRMAGSRLEARACQILKSAITYDPRIKSRVRVNEIIAFCFGKIDKIELQISPVGFSALRDDVFKTLAELDVAKVFIDQVMRNVDKARDEWVTDGQVEEAIDPLAAIESFRNRIGNDPRLCNRLGAEMHQLTQLHESLIEAALNESEFEFSDAETRQLLTLLKAKNFEYIQLNAMTQNLMMTLADVGVSKISIDSSVSVYTTLIMTPEQLQLRATNGQPAQSREVYKFEKVPTGRPIPEAVQVSQLAVSWRGAKNSNAEGSASERWIDCKKDLTPTQAKNEAIAWVEKQNKLVYGTYQFADLSFNNQKMSFEFRVIFTKQEPSLFQRIGGQKTLAAATEVLTRVTEFDPRINSKVPAAEFLEFAFGCKSAVDLEQLSHLELEALEYDLFSTLAEISTPKHLIEQVFNQMAE